MGLVLIETSASSAIGCVDVAHSVTAGAGALVAAPGMARACSASSRWRAVMSTEGASTGESRCSSAQLAGRPIRDGVGEHLAGAAVGVDDQDRLAAQAVVDAHDGAVVGINVALLVGDAAADEVGQVRRVVGVEVGRLPVPVVSHHAHGWLLLVRGPRGVRSAHPQKACRWGLVLTAQPGEFA